MTGVFIKRGNWTQTYTQAEGDVKMKAEINQGDALQAKKHQRLPANPQKQRERPGIDCPSEPWKGPALPTP